MSSQIAVGNRIEPFEVIDVLGKSVTVPSEKPVFFTFYRFATCPFCNLRLREVQAFAEKHPEIDVVGVFGSPAEEVAKAIDIHHLTFPLIANEEGDLYQKFGLQESVWGMLKGMFGRSPRLLKLMIVDRFIPWRINRYILTMPAEFLIAPDGEVLFSFYGKDEGHRPKLAEVEELL